MFFLVLALTAASAILLLLPFASSAKHLPASGTQMFKTMKTVFVGSEDLDLKKRAATVKKAFSVFLCMFFWGMGANMVQHYFEEQAEMMVKPFKGWNSTLQLLFDGPPQMVIVPMIYFGKRALEARGYTISHQKII